MTIRQRLLIAIAMATLVVVAAVAAAGWWAVRGRFDATERQLAHEHLELVRSQFGRHLAGLYDGMADWSDWDSAWTFAEKTATTDPWIADNITPAVWSARGFDLLAILDDTGRQRLAWGWDQRNGEVIHPPAWAEAVTADTGWLRNPEGGRGVVATPDGPHLAILRPIRHGDRSGPRRGWMLWTVPVDSKLASSFACATGVTVALFPIPPRPPASTTERITTPDELTLQAQHDLSDPTGRLVAGLMITMPRDLHRAGLEAYRQLILAALAIAAFCAAVALVIVETGIARPLTALDRDLAAVARSADPALRVPEHGAAEVAGVARSMNATLAALQTAQQSLAEDAAERRALMEAMPDRILVAERDGILHPAGGPSTGSERIVTGGTLGNLVPLAEREKVTQMLAQARRGQRSILLIHDEHNGRQRHQEMRLFPIPDGRVLVLLRDVTSRVEDERRLELATAAAEAANQAKGSFLANISHELRSPLNGILGMTQLLRAETLTDLARERLQVVEESADDLLALINQLLDLSKIDSERCELVDELFSPIEVAHHVVEALSARAWIKRVDVELVCTNAVPRSARGDAGRLRQVLTNLVANAIKFTDHGEVVLRLDAAPTSEGRVEISGSVSDTGPGISPDVAARLFKPFEQGGAIIADRYGGTGLGLAIAKGLVELMHGRISLESKPGSGSTFRFTAQLGLGVASSEPVAGPELVTVLGAGATLRESVHAALVRPGTSCGDIVEARTNVVVVDADTADAPLGLPTILLAGPHWRGHPGPAQAVVRKPAHPDRLREAVIALWQGQTPSQPLYSRPSPADGIRRARVLVVDDQHVNCMVAVGLLRMLGMQADAESDPQRAVVRVLEESWDLVLMDCRMPGIDGYEATRRIRARETTRRSVIVALTANAMSGDRELCLAAGMDDHLTKPLKTTELEAILLRWLGCPVATSSIVPPPALSGRLRHLGAQIGSTAVREVARGLLESVPRLLDRCATALADGDATELLDAAHTLKGDASTCLLDELASPAATLTESARTGRCDPAMLAVLEQARTAWIVAEPSLRTVAYG